MNWHRENNSKPMANCQSGLRRNLMKVIGLCLIFIVLPLFGCSPSSVTQGSAVEEKAVVALTNAEPADDKTPIVSHPSKVTLVAVGDDLIHSNIFKGARTKTSYDFKPIYAGVAKAVYSADVALINQETIMAGSKYGYSGYPRFNTPQQLAYDLQKTGFDVMTISNNHTLDKFGQGLLDYISFLKKVQGIGYTGAYVSAKERNTPYIIEKNGIKIAILSYTYGSNSAIPKGRGYMLPILNRDSIRNDVENAKTKADFIIATVHWGVENSLLPTKTQKEWAAYMNSLGVDAIIGHHPHVLQPAGWITGKDGKKTFVAYSLGNFVSGQMKRANLLGGMLSLTIEKGENGTKITTCKIVPVVTHYDIGLRNTREYFLNDYTSKLAARHGVKIYDKPLSVDYLRSIAKKVLGKYYGHYR